MLLLDTNIVLAIPDDDLRADERRALDGDRHWATSAIVLWEIPKLFRDRRITIGLDTPSFRVLLRDLDVLPITLEIARQSQRLDFEADPVDEIVADTSIPHGAALVTRDTRILGSKVVPLAVQ